MKVTFLGTGTSQGVPVIACTCPVCRSLDFRDKRLRTSVHIAVEDKSIIIDTGPDFRAQVLREKINTLDAVIFTHEHKDHTAGLDDVRGFNFAQRKDMPVYGKKNVLNQLKKEFSYAFTEKKYPGVPMITLEEIENRAFKIDSIEILPVEVMHAKLPVFGYKIGQFAYITDANYISESEKKKLIGLDTLVLNALQKDPHISHFTLDEALEVIKELNPKKTYLTHISHKLGTHKSVEKELPENVEIAYDGLKFEV